MTFVASEIWHSPTFEKQKAGSVWVDMETSGLDAQADYPLEIGAIVLDEDWNEMASFKSLIYATNLHFVKARCVPAVIEMHTKNGLFDELEQLEKLGVQNNHNILAVDRKLREFLNSVAPKETMEMCGSTIFFDRAFMQVDLPDSFAWFHYRNIDVTSIWNMARRIAPEVYEGMRQVAPEEKKHRVLDDIRESIRYLKYMKDHFMIGRHV